MKTKLKLLAVVILATFYLQPSTSYAQGTLTPPGAPAVTMKTLAQIEPRTPISSVPFTITNSGSYYLTTNLTATVSNAIVILTNGVTLDLSGFTMSSTVANAANGGTAILLGGSVSDITICNGHIRGGVTNNGINVYSGSGFGYGVYYSGNAPANVLVLRVSVAGCLNYGIYLSYGNSTMVESCTVQTMGGYGIFASTIKQSAARDCGFTAIAGNQVADCRGESSSNGSGVFSSTIALNCYGFSINGDGLDATTAQNCYGFSSSGYGISATTTQNCYGSSSSSYGLFANTAQNCYGYCNGSSYGLYASITAQNCYGYSSVGTGLSAFIASVCHGATLAGTALSTTHNVNSF